MLGIALALLSAPAPSGEIVAPHTMPPGHYGVVFVLAGADAGEPDAEGLVKLPLSVRFTPVSGGADVVRDLTPIWARPGAGEAWWRPALRVVKGPDAKGEYTVGLESGGRRLATTATTVVGPWGYAAAVSAVVLVLGTLLGLAVLRSGRWRWASLTGAALLAGVTGPWWVGGQVAFVLLGPVLAGLRRSAVGRATFVSRASLAVLCFQELYWGTVVNGAFWTAPVVSLTGLLGVAYLAGRLVRSDARRAALALVLAALGSVLYVATNIYKAFFLDIPAIAVAGDAGQVGRLLDSVLLVTRVTHLLALCLPLVVVGLAMVPAIAADATPEGG